MKWSFGESSEIYTTTLPPQLVSAQYTEQTIIEKTERDNQVSKITFQLG